MPQKSKDYYDKFFSKYNADVHDDPRRFLVVAALLQGRVLDLACGTGTLADYYLGEYVGTDISDVAIKTARELRRKDAVFFPCDLSKEPFKSTAPFDSAYCGEFLEHIEDDTAVFKTLQKCVKPGGVVYFTVPNGNRVPDESHCREFTVASIRDRYSKYGKVRFHNWAGQYERILFSITMGTHYRDELTLVMIVKDEEKGIEKAILSCLPIVDKVVVSVDTATTDRTREIAKMYADVYKEHVWENDFSKARNYAQEGVESKWILFLDGHEYVDTTGDLEKFLQYDVEGIFVTVKMESGLEFMYPRIYRSFVQFKNAVHNVNEVKTKRVLKDFVIMHDRDGGQSEESREARNKQRDEMMPKALGEQLKQNPRNARALFHLGNYWLMKKEYKKSLYFYKRYMKCYKSPDEAYVAQLNIGFIRAAWGQYLRAYWAFLKADKISPERWETHRVLAGLYMSAGRYQKAIPQFVESMSNNKRAYAYQPMKKDLAEIWDLIGHCYAKIDRPKEAVMAFTRASKITEDVKRKRLYNDKIRLLKTVM